MTRDRRLPPCVYLKHGAYYLVKHNRWTRLGRTVEEAMAEYGRIIAGPTDRGLSDLLDETLARAAERVKPATLAQYRTAARKISAAFVEFAPAQVRARHIAQYLDHLRATPNMANRCRSVLKMAFDLAVLRGECDINPVPSVPRHKERHRGRYLTDAEYHAIWQAASPILRCIMDLCYGTGQRIGDVLGIRLADITEDGILFRPSKTTTRDGQGKQVLIAMTPMLQDATRRAKALHGSVPKMLLLGLRKGGAKRSYRGARDLWDSATSRAGILDAHLHDLRAKAITDAKRQGLDPQALGLHSTAAQTARYLRGREIAIVHGPSLRHLIDAAENAE